MEDEAPNVAGAIYGTILSIAVVATLSFEPSMGPIRIAGWTAATAIVFWIAHAYGRMVAEGFSRPALARDVARRALRHEWPMVQASFIPAITLLLAPLGLVGATTAEDLAIAAGVAVLFAAGLIIGRRQGLGWGRCLLIASINAVLGLVIVALKVFVH